MIRPRRASTTAPRAASVVTKPQRVRRNHFRREGEDARRPLSARLKRGGALLLGGAGFVALNLLLILGHDLIVQWPALRCEELRVEGCQRLSESAVLTQAGMALGDNLLGLNLGLARRRLVAHPWIAEAEISREIPSRVRVRIREQRCLAVVDLGTRFLVNPEGKIFKELGPDEAIDAPVITGLAVTDLGVAGGAVSPLWQAALDLLRLSPASGGAVPLERIGRIHTDREIGLVVHLAAASPEEAPAVMHLGFEGFEEKLRRWQQVLARWQDLGGGPGIRAIDLQNLERVIVTPSMEASGNGEGKEV